jgi:hypothetical protein
LTSLPSPLPPPTLPGRQSSLTLPPLLASVLALRLPRLLISLALTNITSQATSARDTARTRTTSTSSSDWMLKDALFYLHAPLPRLTASSPRPTSSPCQAAVRSSSCCTSSSTSEVQQRTCRRPLQLLSLPAPSPAPHPPFPSPDFCCFRSSRNSSSCCVTIQPFGLNRAQSPQSSRDSCKSPSSTAAEAAASPVLITELFRAYPSVFYIRFVYF